MVRADMRADKVTIVASLIKLRPGDAQNFWIIYHEYETQVVKLTDQRVSFVKEYTARYDQLTDVDAKVLAGKCFDWEAARTQLRKTYFDQFASATSPTTGQVLPD